MAIPFTNWKSSRSKSVRLGQSYMRSECESYHKWLMFWRRIRRGKKRSSEFTLAMQKTYDPESYWQNFDEGSERIKSDNLCRSFSARYANPSSKFDHRKELMGK